jgi:hypothetical protein
MKPEMELVEVIPFDEFPLKKLMMVPKCEDYVADWGLRAVLHYREKKNG